MILPQFLSGSIDTSILSNITLAALVTSGPGGQCIKTRSLWSIVTSCAATIFACIYKSFHPNLPSPFDGWALRVLRSLLLMLITLIFPETVLFAALREYLDAREWTSKFQDAIKTRRRREASALLVDNATPSDSDHPPKLEAESDADMENREPQEVTISFSEESAIELQPLIDSATTIVEEMEFDIAQAKNDGDTKLDSDTRPDTRAQNDLQVDHGDHISTRKVRFVEPKGKTDEESGETVPNAPTFPERQTYRVTAHRLEVREVENDYPMFRWIKWSWLRKQFVSVSEEALEFPEWTIGHSLLTGMGGFIIYYQGRPLFTPIPEELLRCIEQGTVDIPDLSEADIQDLSKADVISKTTVIIQVLWFVVQFLSRFPEQFDVTPLEIGTFAYCFMCFVIYACWWKKPLGVTRPYHLYWIGTTPPESNLPIEEATGSAFYHVMGEIRDALLEGEFQDAFAALSTNIIGHCFFPNVSIPVEGERYRFRVHSLGQGDSENGLLVIVLVAVTVIFGGFHLLGWSTNFPSTTDQLIWRSAALITTLSPIGLCILFAMALSIPIWIEDSFPVQTPIFLLLTAFIALYVVGRIMTITLMLTTLRRLPGSAYCVIPWVELIPHF